MQTVGLHELWTIGDNGKAQKKGCEKVRQQDGYLVANYMELARKVAHLQFKNPAHVLLFRGQNNDFPAWVPGSRPKSERFLSSLKPSIFRGINDTYPGAEELERRFNRLSDIESELLEILRATRYPRMQPIRRQRILRWAILQHYELCPTPLLDVTHALRIAASFASQDSTEQAYIFVLGVPQISGAVTADAAAGVQIVRLSSVCPPEALRPHIQEGYLVGEYPEIPDFDQKRNYKFDEIDFGLRLVAKFRFNPAQFWNNSIDFPPIRHPALYPENEDRFFRVLNRIRPNRHHEAA